MDCNSSTDKSIKLTQTWIREFVIGHDLCPFAAKPFAEGRIDYVEFRGEDLVGLTELLTSELLRMKYLEPSETETAFVICPDCLSDFVQYLDFHDLMKDIMESLDLNGIFQLVSFHPDYQFGDAPIDGPENYTNRSPFPMFQILREESVENARRYWGDLDKIPARNIDYLRKIGIDELNAWWHRFRRSH